ncbi:hypothetical protein HU200_044743 [Digitaria exilis]|uniref:Uncharacterized protein n=1 Tax=Digitaria exilis TaxID=1010633 RepID=A0A835B262_9POAL|nr:hypothetical protein HU200_044743 [Digitaria exilis]
MASLRTSREEEVEPASSRLIPSERSSSLISPTRSFPLVLRGELSPRGDASSRTFARAEGGPPQLPCPSPPHLPCSRRCAAWDGGRDERGAMAAEKEELSRRHAGEEGEAEEHCCQTSHSGCSEHKLLWPSRGEEDGCHRPQLLLAEGHCKSKLLVSRSYSRHPFYSCFLMQLLLCTQLAGVPRSSSFYTQLSFCSMHPFHNQPKRE